uniref:Uncharacterized protein n=1 Tax=Arundo donax TaxID=35708 RepID=A0A0A9ERX2_ARUDO
MCPDLVRRKFTLQSTNLVFFQPLAQNIFLVTIDFALTTLTPIDF